MSFCVVLFCLFVYTLADEAESLYWATRVAREPFARAFRSRPLELHNMKSLHP